MQIIELERRLIKPKDFVMRSAEENDCETLITEDTLVTTGGGQNNNCIPFFEG